jgi:hypothetical protein
MDGMKVMVIGVDGRGDRDPNHRRSIRPWEKEIRRGSRGGE